MYLVDIIDAQVAWLETEEYFPSSQGRILEVVRNLPAPPSFLLDRQVVFGSLF